MSLEEIHWAIERCNLYITEYISKICEYEIQNKKIQEIIEKDLVKNQEKIFSYKERLSANVAGRLHEKDLIKIF